MDEIGWIGFVSLGDTLTLRYQCRNASGTPTAPDSGGTVDVYGESDTPLLDGQAFGASDIDGKVGWRKTSLAITSGNGFESGKRYDGRGGYTTGTGAVTKAFTFSFGVL